MFIMRVLPKEKSLAQQGEVATFKGVHADDAAGLGDIIASSGISPRLWRLYAVFWLVCLFFPLLYLANTRPTTIRLILALTGLAIFAATYLWVMWPYPLGNNKHAWSSLRSTALLPISMSLLALLLSVSYGSAFAWLFLGASAISGVILPARDAFWVVSGLTLLTLGVCVIVSGGILATDWLQVVPLVLLVRALGVDMTGLIRLADTLQELNRARQALAQQAVTKERLRMARDLHDLLGHSLSLITIKSELAGRLVERDPAQAKQEIEEVERAARQALREVRQAVSGYRQQSLAGELDGARQILEAAGIDCRIEMTDEGLPPNVEEVLTWVVREGVTNVIRHSRARRCTIRITNQGRSVRSEVLNDGYAEADFPEHEAGSGLSGLAERLATQGGSLEAGPITVENNPGYRLRVELPYQSLITREERQGK
jgi:two-component system sensor histidine kinase DesK